MQSINTKKRCSKNTY